MNKSMVGLALLAVWCGAAVAQNKIYRCGNEYINNPTAAQQRGCSPVDGGNVTVIQSSGVSSSSSAPRASSGGVSASAPSAPRQTTSPAGAPKVSNETQTNRDSDARTILDAELRKSQERLTTLEAEYNGGTPVRTALELRNPQGYIERTANLKADIERTQADIDGIQRELARLR